MELVKEDGVENNNIKIYVDKLTVWTPEEKSWRRKVTKPKKMVLNDVSVCINQGEFVAALGPSGAGKTTFLISVAGKCTLPAEGTVSVNGTNVRHLQKGVVEVVPQFDVFMDALTVMEHLVFMTEMKLGSWKKAANRMILDNLIIDLKLRSHVRTKISTLSGGQRRLLSLASTLLSNPQIIICDEPTTGLDSYSAALVVSILKNLAASGKVVVCSVHQPSSDLFKEFNSIMLMAEGRMLFHGPQQECQRLFESIDLRCPTNYNPAEFYIRTVSSELDSKVNKLEEIWKKTNRFEKCDETDATVPRAYKILKRNWCIQVYLLLWRSSLALKRNIGEHLVQLLLNVLISAMVISACYAGISGTTQRGIQDIRGFLWLLTSEICFSVSYSALYIFEADLILFRREVGVYKGSAFFASRMFSFMPRCIIWAISYTIIASLAVQLPNHVVTTLELMVCLICGAIGAAAYGLGMGALFTSTGIMGDVMTLTDLPFLLASGVFLRLSTLPIWILPAKYISHFYYTMDAASNIYWRQIDFIECATNSTLMCIRDGASVLMESGYSSDFIFQDGLGLLCVTLFWSLLGYYGLRREEKKGYAY